MSGRTPTLIIARACLACSCLLTAFGCPSGGGPDRIPIETEAAPPPPELSEAMWLLRDRAQDLDEALRPRGALTRGPDPATVAPILEDMRGAIDPLLDELDELDRPLLEHYLPELARSLDEARDEVGAEPPRFDEAREVTRACLRCHEQRP